jgi:hypothetical protein
LAGDLGVAIYDAMLKQRLVRSRIANSDAAVDLALTKKGRQFIEALDVDFDGLNQTRRPMCRPCLDWSVRRHHLAGALGAALLDHCYRQKWAKRIDGTRVVHFTPRGERALRAAFGLRELDT